MSELFDELPELARPAPRSRGGARLRQPERDQVALRPVALDELIGADHLARLVWHLVGRFDLTPLLDRIVSREGAAGHPHTDPRLMVSLWLYATLDGVASARELARLCAEHAAYRWLCGGVTVNHHTLSDFRVMNADWLDAELARSLAALLAAGVVGVETVAQDGLRVRADAGAGSFRRAPRLREFQRLAQARVAQLAAAAAADPAAQKTRRQAALARAAMPDERARKARNKGEPDQARVSTTDPQARVMKMPDGGFRPAYNLQVAAEAGFGLIVGVMVGTSGADQDALDPMHRQVAASLGRVVPNWLVDGGYVSRHGIEQVSRRGSRIHAPLGPLADQGSAAVQAWRERMNTADGRALYRGRAQTIEWVNACLRNRGLIRLNVRGQAKVRAVALWHALAHNVRRILTVPELAAAAS